MRYCGEDYFLYMGNFVVQIYHKTPNLDFGVIEEEIEGEEPDYHFVFDRTNEIHWLAGTAGTEEGLKELQEMENKIGRFVTKHGFGFHVEIDDKPLDTVLDLYAEVHSSDLVNNFPSEWLND
jgi:hypothetical protein